MAAGASGIAVGVHTTQFAIRDPKIGLLRPVLELALEEMRTVNVVKIAGVCGCRAQAIEEAELAAALGYDAVLLSLGALRDASISGLLDHARAVASILPIAGFYLQPAVGGRVLPFEFWTSVARIDNLVAIKIAPFNRYQTLDVVRAIAASGRASEIALYTGNDDNILFDLLSRYSFGDTQPPLRIVGGLLGHWAVWTSVAAAHLNQVSQIASAGDPVSTELFELAWQVTDSNAALFDPAHQFHGCIPGLHENLRRQGLLAGRWCLDPNEDLSPGQLEEIDRVCAAYPHLTDDSFVQQHRDAWLR